MEIANVLTHEHCDKCKFHCGDPLTSPLCMSCRWCEVIGKGDNFEEIDPDSCQCICCGRYFRNNIFRKVGDPTKGLCFDCY